MVTILGKQRNSALHRGLNGTVTQKLIFLFLRKVRIPIIVSEPGHFGTGGEEGGYWALQALVLVTGRPPSKGYPVITTWVDLLLESSIFIPNSIHQTPETDQRVTPEKNRKKKKKTYETQKLEAMDIFLPAYPISLCATYTVSRLVSGLLLRNRHPYASKHRRTGTNYIAYLHIIFSLSIVSGQDISWELVGSNGHSGSDSNRHMLGSRKRP